MEMNSLCNSLLKWLETFPDREGISVPQLTDGVVMATVLHQIAPEYFSQFWLSKIKADVGDNWRLKVSNLRKVLQGIVDYFQEQLNTSIKHFLLPDLNKIGEHGDKEEMGRMLQLILGCAVNCESKQEYIKAIMSMEERVQKVIMEAIQELMLRESSPGIVSADSEGRLDLGLGGPASFHPHIKTVMEQLETASHARDELVQRCHELEQQLSMLTEEKRNLNSENEKLVSRLEDLEMGGELGTSTLRYKDLKKQIDGLQDELYKLETSRDEYRTKAEVVERENQEVQSRNEDLQQLASQVPSLKDEVDALREMSERAVVYEGTMETYKKKLEELSDLKRQVRILEDKNSDYMQHNMELEEEVKKSGTWRPQLELYKKQVTDLHQKFADEAKKTDRQIFENKKMMEKMEALSQEKDRLTMERDQLKESLEELRCHISTLTSPDTSSRPPSDLSDVDLLEVIPHDIRQRLIRLQHENSLLKQRVSGDSTEQLPVLQTLVSDLQERQNSLTQENRWDSKGDIGHHIPLHRTGSTSPPHSSTFSLLDAYFTVNPTKKMKLFKRNLKWASESDLLILRQPKSLLSTNFLSSTLPLKQPRSLPPLPVPSFTSFATQTSKESPIVIRHIHEFKMSPSPTNEDSGCCRTSPSSCEGCEDSGCTRSHSPDYAGTLDSGVSGIYCGTLESGVSGVFRCLSPVIPSIVEECTTHHVSDILPALGGRGSSPGVMHHSHPAHTSCMHCCSPYPAHGDDDGVHTSCVSPLPPRPHTVCSYTSPYQYQNASLPPSSLLPNLPCSPPSSPLPTSSPLTLITSSFCTTTTETEPALQERLNGMLQKPAKDKPLQTVTLSSVPTTVVSTIAYTSTVPLPVSSPPGRRSGSGFPRPSLPPESPTPHNSPRLPNSINATRSRANKIGFTAAALSEMSPGTFDIPVVQSILVGRSHSQESSSKSPERIPNKEKSSKSNDCEASDDDEHKTGSQIHLQNNDSSLLYSSDSSDVCVKPKELLRDNSPVRTPWKTSQQVQRSEDIVNTTSADITSLPKEILHQNPERSEKLKNDIENISVPKSKTSPLQEKRQAGSFMSKTPFIRSSNDRLSLRTPMREPKDTEGQTTPNLRKLRFPGVSKGDDGSVPFLKSTGIINTGNQSPKSNLSSRNSSPAIAKKNVLESLPANKTNNHVKFREPVVSQVAQSNCQPDFSHYSPASPRERMSPPKATLSATSPLKTPIPAINKTKVSVPVINHIRSEPVNNQSNKSPKVKKNPPVKLVSDTLFTRFVVSPQSERLGRKRFTSTTDTDTDLDTLERRLTLGMYDAPLVSSESCTSVGPDGDEDPSATEYCTDNEGGDYNPNQFKANMNHTLNKANNHTEDAKLLQLEPDIDEEDENGSSSLVRTYSFFKRQSKVKKQRKVQGREAVPPPQTGGVVKHKNKTAKHVVAETFSAMFTLCTP